MSKFDLYSLTDFGLSKNIFIQYKDVNILFFIFLSKVEINNNIKKITDSTYEKIQSSIDEKAKLDNDWKTLILLKHYIHNNQELIDLDKVEQLLDDNDLNSSLVEYVIDFLETNNYLIKIDFKKYANKQLHEVFNSYESVLNYVKNNLNPANFDIVVKYEIENQTLQNISDEKNISKEGIRQIINKSLRRCYSNTIFDFILNQRINIINSKMSILEWLNIVINYDINYETFHILTNHDKKIFNILMLYRSIFATKNNLYLKPMIDFIKCVEDLEIVEEILRVNKKMVSSSGELESRKSLNLIKSVFGHNEILSSETIKQRVYEKYSKDLDIRLVERVGDDCLPLLSLGGKKYICIDEGSITDQVIKEISDVLHSHQGFFGFDYFLKNNLNEISNNIGIYSEAALHNLCKKIIDNDDWVKFNRMPTIYLGIKNKDEFFIEKINELSPISIKDFAEYMNINYGLNKSTIISNVPVSYPNFYSEGILSTDLVVISNQEEINLINNYLNVKDIVFKKDFELFLKQNNIDTRCINNSNLSNFGYSMNSNLLIKKGITIKEIILEKIHNQGVVSYDELKKLVGDQYYNYLNDIINSCEAIRISKREVATLESRKIREYRNQLIEFKKDLIKEITDVELITLRKIKEKYSGKYQFLNILDNDTLLWTIAIFQNIHLVNDNFDLFCSKSDITLKSIIITKLKSSTLKNISIEDAQRMLNNFLDIYLTEKHIIDAIKLDYNIEYDEQWKMISIDN